MVVMGIDPGAKRIGIALSDPTGFLASPHSVLQRTTLLRDLEAIAKIVADNDVSLIVVGLPLHMSGKEGDMAERARDFAEDLRAQLKLPVILVDERLSSVEAERQLERSGVRRGRRRERLDAVAAAVVLQGYLDTERNRAAAEALLDIECGE